MLPPRSKGERYPAVSCDDIYSHFETHQGVYDRRTDTERWQVPRYAMLKI